MNEGTNMATPTRIYHVNVEDVQYLVRATHPSAALMHVARNISSTRVASQDDLVQCLSEGIKIENAREETPEPAPVAAPAEEKSLPLWPMPSPASSSADDQVDEDEEDDDDGRPAQDGQVAGGVPQRQRIAAKYRCPMTGSTWSGRGLQPTWLKVALAGGRTLADFQVTQPA